MYLLYKITFNFIYNGHYKNFISIGELLVLDKWKGNWNDFFICSADVDVNLKGAEQIKTIVQGGSFFRQELKIFLLT